MESENIINQLDKAWNQALDSVHTLEVLSEELMETDSALAEKVDDISYVLQESSEELYSLLDSLKEKQ